MFTKKKKNVCREKGIDISKQISRSFKVKDFDEFDIILVMATDVREDVLRYARNKHDASKVMLFMDLIHPGKEMDVADPWYGGKDGFYDVFDTIMKGCQIFVEKHSKKM